MPGKKIEIQNRDESLEKPTKHWINFENTGLVRKSLIACLSEGSLKLDQILSGTGTRLKLTCNLKLARA